jgi:hypothetical protein
MESSDHMIVRFTEDEIELMHLALDRWGLGAQIGQAVEECAELIVALQKYSNRSTRPGSADGIIDEIVDVEMMLAQLRIAFSVDDDTYRRRIAQKFARLNEYLQQS